jgi:hypothetical protein
MSCGYSRVAAVNSTFLWAATGAKIALATLAASCKDTAEAAKANAEAARLNAEAAKENMELLINRERARLRIEVDWLKTEYSKIPWVTAHLLLSEPRYPGLATRRLTRSWSHFHVAVVAGR